MLDPLDKESQIANRTLQRVRRWAYGVIIGERLVHAFGPLVLWLALFSALWISGLSEPAPHLVRVLLFFVFFAGVCGLVLYALKDFSLPARHDVYRRLEREFRLTHSPLRHFEDQLANPRNAKTRSLWHRSQIKNLDFISGLKLIRPQPVLARSDPFCLRYCIVLFLICSFTISGAQSLERFRNGLIPFSFAAKEAAAGNLTLWIQPPAYTNLQDIIVTDQDLKQENIAVPEGSRLKARVSNGWGRPKLHFSQGQAIAFEKTDEKNWALETEIPQTERVLITQFFHKKIDYKINYIKDLEPVINLVSDIEKTAHGALRAPLSLYDDYGVSQIFLQVELAPGIDGPPHAEPINKTRTILSPPAQKIKISPVYDLAAHYWAGLPVNLTFKASDAAGHITSTAPIPLTLPEKEFYNPVARTLVKLRKKLIWEAETDRLDMAYEMEALLTDPARLNNNIPAFLSIRSMASRLAYDQQKKYTQGLIAQMWDTALLIEEGTLSLATRNMAEARERLEDLLADKSATPEEITQAVNELQEAMGAYFQELAQALQKQMGEQGTMPELSPEMLENAIKPEDLADFLNQLKRESIEGDRNTARKMLSELQQMMEGLNPSRSGSVPPEMQQLAETLAKMQNLIQDQKTLREKTKTQAEQASKPDSKPQRDGQKQEELKTSPSAPSSSPSASPQGQHQEQENLRHELGEIMRETGEVLPKIPQNMQDAEGEMRQASKALEKSDSLSAVPHQDQTIEFLEQGQEQMQQKMSEMVKQMQLMAFGQGPTDPLGRPLQDGDSGIPYSSGQVKIPDEAQRKKAQDILELLRKRSGEYNRPEHERDYFRRLMKKF